MATWAAVAAACSEPLHRSPRRECSPTIVSSAVTPNPHNAISAIVSASIVAAESASVRFGAIGSNLESTTPAVRAEGGTITFPVLGLLPDAPYRLRVVAYGECGTAVGEELSFGTSSLPADLPSYSATGDGGAGFVAFAAGRYGIVIDNTGRVVWYRRFPDGPGLNFQAQPNGRYVARPPVAEGQAGAWIEVDAAGEVTRQLGCARGLQPRFHDMLVTLEGSYWLMCDETRTLDLSAMGGSPSARVTGTVIQGRGPTGELLFDWSAFDHLDLADLDSAQRSGASVNWTHGNAFDLASDGNILVSFRNLNQVIKIDVKSGTVIWRLGGRSNQFSLEGDDPIPFRGQHGVRATRTGILLLDNLGSLSESRAEHWVVNEASLTARLAERFSSQPPTVAQLGGAIQPLAGDHVLVAFGSAGRVEEYDHQGRVTWRLTGSPGYIYRAQRIGSLYRPGFGSPR